MHLLDGELMSNCNQTRKHNKQLIKLAGLQVYVEKVDGVLSWIINRNHIQRLSKHMHNVWIVALKIISDIALTSDLTTPCRISCTAFIIYHIYVHEHRPAIHHHMIHQFWQIGSNYNISNMIVIVLYMYLTY